VLDVGRILSVPTGSELAREGAADTDFFVLLDGELAVSVLPGDGGISLEVGTVRPGGSFGEMGALLGDRRTANVVAARASRLLQLDGASLQSLFARCPGFGWAFSRELARNLKNANALKNELQADISPETMCSTCRPSAGCATT